MLFFTGGIMKEQKIFLTEVSSVYDSVKELYLSYCEELDREKKSLEQITNDMKEAEKYLSYLSTHQNSDAFVFSPRGVISKNTSSVSDGLYDTGKVIDFSDTQKKKDELSNLEDIKKSSEERIKRLDSTIAILESNKAILKEVSDSRDSFEEEKRILKERTDAIIKEYEQKENLLMKRLKEGPTEKFSFLIHTIDMIEKYMDNDPMRAKLELKKLKDDILSLTKDFEQII